MTDLRLNYIGSKRTLLTAYAPIFEQYLSTASTFADLFCGTGVVSEYVQHHYPNVATIYANDLQRYASVLTEARLLSFTSDEITEIQEHYTLLNQCQTPGFFAEHYAGKYFSPENCERLDGMRQYIETSTTLSTKVRTFLLASLLSASDAVANTASVYGAYLKKLKDRALQPLKLTALPTSGKPVTTIKVSCDDIESLSIDEPLDVLYLDPPYNARQYGSNYHVLETIVRYDAPVLKGVTLLPPYPKSTFCSKAGGKALTSLSNVVNRFNWKVLMMSYSSDGIIPIDKLLQLLQSKGKVIAYQMNYKKFQSQVLTGVKAVTEYLLVCEAGGSGEVEYREVE